MSFSLGKTLSYKFIPLKCFFLVDVLSNVYYVYMSTCSLYLFPLDQQLSI